MADNGAITLYEYRNYDYFPVIDFNLYVKNHMVREIGRLETDLKNHIAFIDNQVDIAISNLKDKLYGEMGGISGVFPYIDQVKNMGDGHKNIIKHRYQQKIDKISDIYITRNNLILRLFVKSKDYENGKNEAISIDKLFPKTGRKPDNQRIKETKKACTCVEKLNKGLLLKKKKPEVRELVKNEMNGIEPHLQTFNDWYRDCEYTRGAGNPHK